MAGRGYCLSGKLLVSTPSFLPPQLHFQKVFFRTQVSLNEWPPFKRDAWRGNLLIQRNKSSTVSTVCLTPEMRKGRRWRFRTSSSDIISADCNDSWKFWTVERWEHRLRHCRTPSDSSLIATSIKQSCFCINISIIIGVQHYINCWEYIPTYVLMESNTWRHILLLLAK